MPGMNENVGEVLGLAFWRLKVEAMDIATIPYLMYHKLLDIEDREDQVKVYS